jgi:hypothetical protein
MKEKEKRKKEREKESAYKPLGKYFLSVATDNQLFTYT